MQWPKLLRIAVLVLTIPLASLSVTSSAWAAGYKVLYKFRGYQHGDGELSSGGVVFDAAGNLYGTTGGGGVNDQGTVFELTPNPDGSWTERVLYSFRGKPDGAFPTAGLVFDAAGNLYGTT